MAETLRAQCRNHGGQGLDPAFPDHVCLSVNPGRLLGGGQVPKLAVLEDNFVKKRLAGPPKPAEGGQPTQRALTSSPPHLRWTATGSSNAGLCRPSQRPRVSPPDPASLALEESVSQGETQSRRPHATSP